LAFFLLLFQLEEIFLCTVYIILSSRFKNSSKKRSAAGYFTAADPLLFKQCAARLTEPLNHFVRLFDAQPEMLAQALYAHTLTSAAVYHLAVKADVVISQRL
jgi:hypothetical protein